jgi:hypothetical protein
MSAMRAMTASWLQDKATVVAPAYETYILQRLYARFSIVLGALGCFGESVRAASNQPQYHVGRDAECRGTFRGVEDAQPSAGASAQIDETPTFGERVDDAVNSASNFRDHSSDRVRN